ncbi:MAG: Undecaprenyl-phosphate glucose phosphotransferase [Parcubacteria group bacterium Gr01-1014_13]|nr:MAG: Undecaprenyl-phosphate glucose phosphotransferase [Parcubacteria group bacterium Gr01-1014_13]
MKKFELTFAFAQLPLDYTMIVLAGITAYGLRFTSFAKIRPVLFNLPWEKFWPLLLLTALGWVIIFAFAGLYSTTSNRKLSGDMTRVILACSTGFAAITIYVFFTLQKFDSRFLVLAGWILAMLYICIGRIIIAGLKKLLHGMGYGLRKTVIIGKETIAEQIKNAIAMRPALGYKLVTTFPHFNLDTRKYLLANHPDEIIFTDPKAHGDEALEAINFANEHHITFKYSADLFSTFSTNMAVSTISGIPIIELRLTRLTGWNKIIKRLADIIGSLFLIILFSPLLILISIIVALETGFPVIYKNERVGRDDEKFFTLKFRSMYKKDSTGAQFGKQGEKALLKEQKLIAKQSIKDGPIYKIKDDPRVTPVGRFLRRWSLDELPQFFNVLKGEMSLVGPRPHQPREVAGYQNQHKIVLAIKPGITGLSQISGRSNLTYEEELNLDTFYIENWSLYLDLIIIFKTPFIVLTRYGSVV